MEKSDAPNPVISKVEEKTTDSAIAVAGHPLHAMTVHFPIALVITTLACDLLYWWSADEFWGRAGVWASGGAFFSGVAAGIIGTAGLLLIALWQALTFRLNKRTHKIFVDEVERLKAHGAKSDVQPETRSVVEDLTGYRYEELWCNDESASHLKPAELRVSRDS